MRSKISGNVIKALVLFIVLANTVCGQAEEKETLKRDDASEKITYIANEGVLIKTRSKQVLIDGLHRKYKDAYEFLPDDLRGQLEGAKKPFDEINLLLVSHLHGDHFHPLSVAEYLKNNPKTYLASSEQIIDGVKKEFKGYKKIKPQIRQVSYEFGKSVKKDFDGISVKFLGLRHGNERFKWIQNLGHLIEMDGRKFLHIGDADMTKENFSVYRLDKENIDVAFIPYWFLLSKEGRSLVREQFAPKHIIAIHISPNDAEEVSKRIKTYYSDITVFTKIFETKDL